MNVVVLDTSSSVCVLALYQGGRCLDRSREAGRSHSQILLPEIEALMAEAGIALRDVDLIVLGQGPGSFTGLRIGVGVVQGLAFGLGLPVAQVSSLAVLAQQAVRLHGARNVLAALHARTDEVFAGTYEADGGLVSLVGAETVARVADLELDPRDWFGVGDGWQLATEFGEKLGRVAQSVPGMRPEAEDLWVLGRAVHARGESRAADQVAPVYLREQVASRSSPGLR